MKKQKEALGYSKKQFSIIEKINSYCIVTNE